MGEGIMSLKETSSPQQPLNVVSVDDDEMIRELIEEILHSFGHSVVSLDCGKALIDLFKSKTKAPDVLLLDLSLPDAFGEKLLDQANRKWPTTRCIICTGHISDQLEEHFAGRATAILRKPFNIHDLLNVVQSK